MDQRQANLTNQKKAAVEFIDGYLNPDLETITFTSDGSVDGSGSWAANAVITVGGTEYQAILGVGNGASEPLPQATPRAGADPRRVNVVFSDGTTEEVR